MHTFKHNTLLLIGGVFIFSAALIASYFLTPKQTQGSEVADFTVECRNATSSYMVLAANVPSVIASTSPQRHHLTFSSSTTDNPEAIWLNKGTTTQAAAGKGKALYGTSSQTWDSTSDAYTGIVTATSKVAARLVVEDCATQ
jgi:hypothetical protein